MSSINIPNDACTDESCVAAEEYEITVRQLARHRCQHGAVDPWQITVTSDELHLALLKLMNTMSYHVRTVDFIVAVVDNMNCFGIFPPDLYGKKAEAAFQDMEAAAGRFEPAAREAIESRRSQ